MGEKEPPKITLTQRLEVLKNYREEALKVGDDLAAMDLADEAATLVYKATLPRLH